MVKREGQKKILVTGADGFVGQEIVKIFSRDPGYELYLLVGRGFWQKNREWADSYLKRGRVFTVDIAVEESVLESEEIGKVEAVIHCAGLAHQFGQVSAQDFFQVNVWGTKNVCRLARRLSADYFFLISSVAVYGNYSKVEVNEEFVCRPCGAYAESKWQAELEARELCRQNNLGLIILRLGTVIGEGDRGNLLRLIMLIDQKKFIWVGQGRNKKSLIYKRDVGEILYRLADFYLTQEDKHFEIFNVTAKPLSMEEIVRAIYEKLERKVPRFYLPGVIVRKALQAGKIIKMKGVEGMDRTLEKWLSDDIYSNRKLKEKHSLEPQTAVCKAIEKEVEYYLKSREKQQKPGVLFW